MNQAFKNLIQIHSSNEEIRKTLLNEIDILKEKLTRRQSRDKII